MKMGLAGHFISSHQPTWRMHQVGVQDVPLRKGLLHDEGSLMLCASEIGTFLAVTVFQV
jgi:hypothetical protein